MVDMSKTQPTRSASAMGYVRMIVSRFAAGLVASTLLWVGLFSYVHIHDGVSISVVGDISAQRRDRRSDRDKDERRIPNVTLKVADKLGEVNELIDTENNPQAALEVLNRMISRGTRRYNGNEMANIYRMFAYVYFVLDDTPNTILYNEKILEHREDIRVGMETTTMFTLAQLYFSVERYNDALNMIEDWLLLADDPGPNPYYFVATIYYQQEDYQKAIDYVKLAIEMATERGMVPIKESWWAMLRFLYYEIEDFPKVIEVLEIMVKEYPKRSAWVQLAGMYGQEGFEKKQVYAMEAASVAGFLEQETDYLQFQGLLMSEEAPIRGAWYLKQGFDEGIVEESLRSLNSLGQAYQMAFEDDLAIEQLEKATEYAEDGKIHKRLAQLYLQKEEYGKCSTNADEALERGDITRAYDVKILKGMCEFNRDELQTAKEAFVEARRDARNADADSAERSARDWIRYIDSEQSRLRQLAAAERSG